VKVLVDTTGKVLSVGEANPGWAVPAGGGVVDTAHTFAEFIAADTQAAGAAQPSEVAWAAGNFAVRTATLSAEQTQRQQDIQTAKAYLANGAPTAAESAAAVKATIRLLRDVNSRLQ
jgi:hypothetical protein